MNHIVIIGFMGSGKTRVGKRLAADLGLPFVDVDKAVTKKMGMTVKEIYIRFGEAFYRALETVKIKELLEDKEQKVVSLSAGCPVLEQNQGYLKKLGTVIYLNGSFETLKKRLENSGSDPVLEGDNKEEKMKKLLKQRAPVYEKLADIEAVTGVKPFEGLVEEIEQKLEAYQKK